MKGKKVLFVKKINDAGLLKKEISAFNACVVCGYCGKTDHLIAEICNPKEHGWVYVEKFDNERIEESGCWFCSERCRKRQEKVWGRRR